MKQFTIIKVGYTAGIYGCSNEYFTLIYINKKGMGSIGFYGMYGPEERLRSILDKNGYKYVHTPSDFGRMTKKEINKYVFVSEYQAIEQAEVL